jgi:hypothetical protein
VGPILHDWIHKHPSEAQELGWIVSQHENPENVIVTIPDTVVHVTQRRKPKASTPEERKARVNYSIRTPKDEENVLPEMEQVLRDVLEPELAEQMDDPSQASSYWVWSTAAAVIITERAGRKK